jgi:hydrogenase nickel incorporation protein HypA/HybF
MHEFGIAESILKGVLKNIEKDKVKKVSRINLKVGQMKMVTEESLQNAFDLVSKDTPARGAKLGIEFIPGNDLVIENIEAETE